MAKLAKQASYASAIERALKRLHNVEQFVKTFPLLQEFYSEINAATLTGAIDVIVVEQEDGGDEEAADQQDAHCHLVVETEHKGVR